MEQQEQQNIKRPKNVEYIYLKNSCFRQDFGPDKQGIFRGWNSPQINEVPQTAMRATKKGHDSCNNPSQKPVGITAM